MQISRTTWTLRTLAVASNIALTIAAVAILGHQTGQGLWIFGTAWFPLVLFATIEIVNIPKLPSTALAMLGFLVSPFVFLLIATLIDDVSIANFIMQSAALILTSSMLAFALQAAVFPVIFKTRPEWGTFINEEVIPQLFGASLGLLIGIWLLTHIVSSGSLSHSGAALLVLGIVQNSVVLGLTLHRNR